MLRHHAVAARRLGRDDANPGQEVRGPVGAEGLFIIILIILIIIIIIIIICVVCLSFSSLFVRGCLFLV